MASLAGAAIGFLEGAALGVHAIRNALALAEGLKSKHAIKQVDRMLSNDGIPAWSLFASWVPFEVGDRPETGRATPLVRRTVMKSRLKGWRNAT